MTISEIMKRDRCSYTQAKAKAESEPPVRSSELIGRCVEAGDDDEGQPRLIIHTTREQLRLFGRNLAFADVVVTIAPPNTQAERPEANV